MKRIVTCREMKEMDRRTIEEYGISSDVLMERAALAVFSLVKEKAGPKDRILVVCGSGNNGGDGIAAARLLHLSGLSVYIYLAMDPAKMTRETAHQRDIAEKYHVPVTEDPFTGSWQIIIDALFGVGLSRNPEGKTASLIRWMNRQDACRIAVDIPSGIHGDTGEVMGEAFRADYTVTFAYRKAGVVLYPGREYAGNVSCADIGIYDTEQERKGGLYAVEDTDFRKLPPRAMRGNKGTFGKVLVAAGSPGMCGAAYMSACAALKCGAGMVMVSTYEENRIPIHTLLPEAMISTDLSEKEGCRLLDWCDILLIGPGLSCSEESRDRTEFFLREASGRGIPAVIDADALNLLAEHDAWYRYLNEKTVLTPHPGEMGRLVKKTAGDITKRLISEAETLAKKTEAVCVLKDACTVTAAGNGYVFLNESGNDGMASAGAGDVLAGMIAGMLCKYKDEEKWDASFASALAVYLHGCCGDEAAGRCGRESVTAGEILHDIPVVLRRLMQEK